MSLVIDEDRMSSTDTPHTAIRNGDHWVVSWLPGGRLTRNEAITAMTLAWEIALDGPPPGPHWPFIVAWARELGLTGEEAVEMCQVGPVRG